MAGSPDTGAAQMLAAWERAGAEAPLQRALTLLAAAWPERTRERWALAPIGERDRQLLVLREHLFGTRIDALATCPACGEALELAFETGQISVPAAHARREFVLDLDGYRLSCRTPDSADLIAAAGAGEQAETLLLERCVTRAATQHEAVAPATLPMPVRAAIEQALRDADPQAEVGIALACPACAHAWNTEFDVLAYLWSEFDDWAGRLLREVHDLASAYGWSERAILAMSATRRRCYLAMIAG